MQTTEFIVTERPLSAQAKDRARLQAWRQLIVLHALDHWPRAPVESGDVHLTIVFLCDVSASIDVDNVVKPIQDALLNVVYMDDVLVTDVDSHRRYIQEQADITGCPRMLIDMISEGREAVYIRIQQAASLGEQL